MLPLPKSFEGQTAEQIVTRLLADAYTPVALNDPRTRLFRDAKGDHLIRLSTAPQLAEAFCDACQKNSGNVFLPQIFSHAALGPDLHIAISENLVTAEEAEKNPVTLFGHARAVSSLFEGDEMHADVHKLMVMDKNILDAVQAIFGCGLKLCKESPVALDLRGSSILFRSNAKGCQTIYANPLIASTETAEESLKKLQWIEKRFSEAERNAPKSPYWR
jgi:hypothetical protein